MRKLKVLFTALAVVMAISMLSGIASAGALDGYTGAPVPASPPSPSWTIIQRAVVAYASVGPVGHRLTTGYY